MNVGDITAIVTILEDLQDRLQAAVDHLDEPPRDEFVAYISGFLTTCLVAVRIAKKACDRFVYEDHENLEKVRRRRDSDE